MGSSEGMKIADALDELLSALGNAESAQTRVHMDAMSAITDPELLSAAIADTSEKILKIREWRAALESVRNGIFSLESDFLPLTPLTLVLEKKSPAVSVSDIEEDFEDEEEKNRYTEDAAEKNSSHGVRYIEDIAQELSGASAHRSVVLCRNGGESEYVASVLRAHKTPHRLLLDAPSQPSLDRWLADVFGSLGKGEFLSKDGFIERYSMLVNEDRKEAERRFYALRVQLGAEKDTSSASVYGLALARAFRAAMVTQGLSADFLTPEPDGVVISTKNLAKGRTFDKIYLLRSSSSRRAQSSAPQNMQDKIEIIGKREEWDCKKSDGGRWLRVNMNYKDYKYSTFCRNLVVGLPSDVDEAGFADARDEILGDAAERQNYIAEEIDSGDKIEILLNQKSQKYYIYHRERPIGRLTDSASQDFRNAVNKSQIQYNIPAKLEDVYVKNVVTVLLDDSMKRVASPFGESGMWLGVTITGFAKISYLSDSQ
ncbi:hypothetical protein FACS1894204_05860 [Synergistales bacterium]|nr:hypothetical protein FACS1894204_05860 [Synergistales bacterium]